MTQKQRGYIHPLPFICGVLIASAITTGCASRHHLQGNKGTVMPNSPIAKKVPHTHTMHGHKRHDPYFWMRDDARQKPDVLDHLKAENEYSRAVMAPTQTLQDHLFEELKGRLKKDDTSVPVRRRNYFYYSRYEAKKEHPIYCRRKGSMEAPETVILDVNKLAKDHDYFNVGSIAISENEDILAYTFDTLSRRIYTIAFIHLGSGEHLPDTISGTSTSLAWAADNRTLFYVDKDDKTLRPFSVHRHTLGTSQKEDYEVFKEKDESFYVGVGRSKSRRFVWITLESTNVSEVLYIEAKAPIEIPKAVSPRRPKIEYSVEHHNDTFYIYTNENAENFKLMAAPITTSNQATTWQTLIAHRPDVMLDGLEVFQDYLVLAERREGQRRLRVMQWSDQSSHDIEFDEEVYTAFAGENPEFNTNTLRLTYSSLATPTSVVDYTMDTRSKTLRKQDEVMGGFNPDDYRSERMWATARDGAKIPISIVMPRDFKKDGASPLYQYAYGAYGYAMDPWFSASRLSLLDRGFAVAIAHVRGGEEMGRQWYNQGRMFNKKNTFTDYIDCSEFLIAEGYTSAKRLIAGGGSAGGLLIGAVANLRPDLYWVMHAAVPFVDVVSTMLDASIPLTTNEYDEWGNPNKKEDYEYMLSYSPYDQVKNQDYPHMIITTGLHDSQVQYWEPMKWVARLRELKNDQQTLVFDIEMDTGHGGASGRYKRFKNTALVYAFFMWMLEQDNSRWIKPSEEAKHLP
jgi:oligopeptidase B